MDHNLYGIDARSGAEVFKSDVGDQVGSGLAFEAGVVYGTGPSGIFGVDAQTGERTLDPPLDEWNFDVNFGINAPLVVDDTLYYAAEDLLALDVDDVREKWQKDSPSAFGARPALVDGVLVTSDAGDSQTRPSDRSIVYGLDPATGETSWRTKVDADSLVSPVAVSEERGIAVLAGRYGTVAAFDVASGEESWRVSVEKDGNVPMRPLVRDGRVFVSSQSAGTHAFGVASGDRQWSIRSREAAEAGRHLAFTDGRVVASTQTTAYELDPASGVVFASHSLSPERVRNTNVAIADGWLYYATGDSRVSRFPLER